MSGTTRRRAMTSRTLRSPHLDHAARRRARSYLVRLWVEPRELDGEEERVLGYVRDLRTGEETYLCSPDELAAVLGRNLVVSGRRNVPGRERTSG